MTPRCRGPRGAGLEPEIELEIERLGAQGDGVASHQGGSVFVPLALPGERWRVALGPRVPAGRRAEGRQLLRPAARATPPCPQFGRCGGCALQHLPAETYAAFKRDRIVAALARRGLREVPVEALLVTPLASRRRLRLAFRRADRQVRLGYRARRSHALVETAVCPIALPELVALFAPLGDLLGRLDGSAGEGEVLLTRAAAGVDLLVTAAAAPSLADRERLAAFATAERLARISWAAVGAKPEPVATLRPVEAVLAGTAVPLPPGAFLQASAFGEAALQAAAAAWTPAGARVADLFAGLGTLGLAVAARAAAVDTFEAVPALCAALAAARHPKIRTERRDLERRPLAAAELGRYDAVLLDPPRAGAAAQVRELAAAGVATVIHASCNPASFARDARTLVDAGYRLVELRPIDQFLYAPEVELIAHFTRARQRPGDRP